MRGFTSAVTENMLGIWAGSTGERFFENVEVPAEHMIGEEGQGFEIAMHSLDQGRCTVAAGACGVVRACLERSVEYARERETFGQAIGRYQFVQDMIAEMVLGYETSKLLVMQAAWLKNERLRNTRATTSTAPPMPTSSIGRRLSASGSIAQERIATAGMRKPATWLAEAKPIS